MNKIAASFPPSFNSLASQQTLTWWTRAWHESANGMMAAGIRQMELTGTLNRKAFAFWEGLALAGMRRPAAPKPVTTEPGVAEPVALEPMMVEPVMVEAVAAEAEPVAVEPVAVEPVAVEMAPPVEARMEEKPVAAPKPAVLSRGKRGRRG